MNPAGVVFYRWHHYIGFFHISYMKEKNTGGSIGEAQRLTEERETTFGLSYREDRNNEASRNRDSTVVILKLRILLASDFNRQPAKQKLIKETVDSS